MKEFTEEIFKKMTKEDSWLRDKNGQEFMSTLRMSYGISATLRATVESVEPDTIDPKYEKSAVLSCMLGLMYQSLPQELSYEARRTIELSKLERRGDKKLLAGRNMSPAELADFFQRIQSQLKKKLSE
jgi:hypothetical protein